jgi:hypothetical protein
MPLSDFETHFRVAKAREPIALIPPALDVLLGRSAKDPAVKAALKSLGFSGLLYVSDGLEGYYAELAAFARSKGLERLMATACPSVSALLSASYPEVAARLPKAILPPAERVVKAARNERPGSTIFFLSPCSGRAQSLARYIDWAVPLSLVFSDLLAALESEVTEPIEPPNSPTCSTAGIVHPQSCALPPGGKRSVAGAEKIQDFLSGMCDQNEGEAARRDLVEFLACSDGCSKGDWAPRKAP